ncbi:MAG: ABC transporter permease [Alphaproteobacteria bacterium]|nr:ABC transporter permease [Alphaproteobacteria bacterium]
MALGLLVPAVLAALWWGSAAEGWLPDQLLPAPSLVWQTLVETAASGDLWADTLISLERVAAGFAVGAAAGLVFGGAIGLSRTLRELLDPLFLLLAQIPPLAWIPLVILVVGIDEAMKVTVIAWASFVPVVLGAAQGIRDVPEPLRELGRALTFDAWSLLSRIILPAAVPAVFTGLREGVANAWQTMVAAELFASTEGLGYLISLGRQLFQLDLVLAMVLVLGVVGLVVNGALALAERQLLRWQAHTP